MHSVFDTCLDVYVTVYLDGILVFSQSEADHLVHLRDVLLRLRAHGLCAKRKKCKFGLDAVEYLGHWVSRGERYMDPGKIRDVVAWPPLSTVR